MALRAKRIRHDASSFMDVEKDGVLSDKHQLVLQYLMHTRMAKKKELSQVQAKLFNDDESLSVTLNTITNKINPLKMDVKRIKCDITGETYYVLIHTTGESFFTRCCLFTKSKLEYLKQVLTGIVLSADGRIGKIQALNSCQVLSKSEADDTIGLFIREKILIETDGGVLCLSPLAIVEFEPFFRACLGDNLFTCDLCKQLVFVSKICDGCEQRFHNHCVATWLASKRFECPKCRHGWAYNMETDSE